MSINALKTNSATTSNEPCRFPLETMEEALRALSSIQGIDDVATKRCIDMREDICTWLLQDNVFGDKTGWCFQEFHRCNALSVGLLAFTKKDRLPIHDHPGSTGLLLVLDGELSIQTFSIDDQDAGRIVDVKKSNEIILTAGEHNIFTPNENNVHTLVSRSESCRVLDIMITPYKEEERTWYMPMVVNATESDSHKAIKFNKKQ